MVLVRALFHCFGLSTQLEPQEILKNGQEGGKVTRPGLRHMLNLAIPVMKATSCSFIVLSVLAAQTSFSLEKSLAEVVLDTSKQQSKRLA